MKFCSEHVFFRQFFLGRGVRAPRRSAAEDGRHTDGFDIEPCQGLPIAAIARVDTVYSRNCVRLCFTRWSTNYDNIPREKGFERRAGLLPKAGDCRRVRRWALPRPSITATARIDTVYSRKRLLLCCTRWSTKPPMFDAVAYRLW